MSFKEAKGKEGAANPGRYPEDRKTAGNHLVLLLVLCSQIRIHTHTHTTDQLSWSQPTDAQISTTTHRPLLQSLLLHDLLGHLLGGHILLG
jgi:hypothetical protein